MFNKSFNFFTEGTRPFTTSAIYSLKTTFPNHELTSLQKGETLFGHNSMRLVQDALPLRKPEEMAKLIHEYNLPISGIRQFTLNKELPEVVRVDEEVYIPFEHAIPEQHIHPDYLNLFSNKFNLSP
jgi:hypothetical protein